MPEVYDDTVELLEDMLERARSGALTGICLGYVDHEGCSGYRAAGMIGSYSLLGATALMQQALARWMLDN